MNKKSVSEWLSYVLLTAFVVALAAFVYMWMTNYTIQTTTDVKERVYNSELCDSMGVSIEACLNTTASQSLYINVTNRGDLRITKIVVRFLQTANSSITNLYDIELDSVIKPQYSRIFNNTQLSLNWTANPDTKVEVVPETEKEGFLIVCNDRKGETYFKTC